MASASRPCASADDKRLQNTLKRLGVNTIPGIEEVNLFKVRERATAERVLALRRVPNTLALGSPVHAQDNGSVIHFSNPKVQASIAANTYVISGHAETKRLQDLLPGILNQVRTCGSVRDLKACKGTSIACCV